MFALEGPDVVFVYVCVVDALDNVCFGITGEEDGRVICIAHEVAVYVTG